VADDDGGAVWAPRRKETIGTQRKKQHEENDYQAQLQQQQQ